MAAAMRHRSKFPPWAKTRLMHRSKSAYAPISLRPQSREARRRRPTTELAIAQAHPHWWATPRMSDPRCARRCLRWGLTPTGVSSPHRSEQGVNLYACVRYITLFTRAKGICY